MHQPKERWYNPGYMTKALHPHIQAILDARSPDDVEHFLAPDYERLNDPGLMHDMEVAVDRILAAIAGEEKILIYADYDADGIPGAVILKDFFDRLGYGRATVYIPHRHDEGYGLHTHAIESAAESGVKLLITIDLGVTAVDQVARAGELGIDAIITDHHEPKAELPSALAIVNPKLGDYPDRMLCGAAVVFQLVRALITKLRETPTDERLVGTHEVVSGWPEGMSKWWLDLVGLSTISDMVPLVGENRILAHYGLRVLRKSRRPGLRALAKETRLRLSEADEKDIGFSITPRINAASRMSHAFDAFEVLAATDASAAETAAKNLSRLNEQRKRITATIMRQVHKMVKSRRLGSVLVIGHPDWNVGVLSIVAGKLVEELERPVFVWTTHGTDAIKGSCRAPDGLSVLELMEGVNDAFSKFGGHEAAGGFMTDHDHIHTLEQNLTNIFSASYPDWSPATGGSYEVDATIPLATVGSELYADLRQLAPFGVGNPEPIFIFSDAKLVSVKQFGKHDDHLEVIVSDTKGRRFKAVSFYSDWAKHRYTPEPGASVRVVGRLEMNRFLGANELRISLIEVLPE